MKYVPDLANPKPRILPVDPFSISPSIDRFRHKVFGPKTDAETRWNFMMAISVELVFDLGQDRGVDREGRRIQDT
jgi:hypothetical protein